MESYNLRSVLELPPPFRSTFNFRYFNSLQSECFPTCFQSDVNMVISAPTGSGKTVLFELCILRLLSRSLFEDGRFVHMSGTLKTIYVAPSKALVQEKLRDWTQKFGACGLSCLEMTGDNDFYNIRNVQEADIILTTPEKFDAVTRFRIRDGGLSFFSDIGLLLIDEVHLLNDPRGAALEAIVSRIKMLSGRPEMKSNPLACVRFVAVSATIPNLEDLADWLMVPPQGMKRFGEEMRPVKLTTKVFGYVAAKNDFLFEKRLQNYIFDILMQYSRGKSALVFCSTRKGAQEAAQKISQTAMTFGYSNPFIKTTEQLERLREASLSCGDKQLQSYILYGVGYHNGGLSMKDRNLIENLFLCGDIQVLCTTNTLAHGVNLPAHTVVIKSTQNYNKEKSAYTEYDRSTVLQMCGRAGRPPFDDTGLVIIMTRKETVHLYENLLSGCEIVESQLLSCMTEHLTAEIVQLTVPDITRAIEWMKCSYLYVRMKKNPETYAVEKGISRDRIERHMQDICVQKVNELSRNQMVWTDEDGFLLKPLEPGRLMTKYYLKFDTMKHIMQAQSNFSLEEALHTVCCAEELSWIQLRRNEKRLLNDINADKNGRLRFHILGDKGKKKKRIQTREEKIFILATDCLTGDPLIHELSLTQDASSICSNGSRIAKCMKEHFIFRKNYKGALNSIILAKSLHHKLWDDSPYLLKQLPGIGMVTAKALHSMGITSFETLADADPRRIEIVTGRKFPFGDHIKESLVTLPPKVELKVEAIESQRKGTPRLAVTLTRLAQAQSSKRHYADLVVGLEKENVITYHEKIRVDDFLSWSNLLVDGDKLKMRRDRCIENFNSTAVQCFYYLESSSLSFFFEKLGPKKQEFVDKGGNKDFMSKEERTLKGMTFASLSLPNGIGLYVVFSPYHTTLTLPNLEVGKLIVKADLIFEEFIGIDIHQKIDLTEEIKSNVNVRLGSKKSSSSSLRPAETCRDKGITVSSAPTKKQPIQSRFNEELDDMPSFRLLDDELDGVQPNQADNDECQIISVNKIFEHIRKKAKDFPEIKASGAVQFPVSKPPKPLREQICTEPTTDHCTSVGDHDQGAIKQGITSTSQLTSSVANYDPKESTDFQAAEKRKESQMIEPKFGHVRKRSKNSPVIVKPDSSGCGSSAQSQECSSVKEPQLSRMGSFRMKETNSGEPPVVSMLFSAPGTSNIEQNESLFMENLKDKRRLPASRTLDLPFEVSNNNPFNRACNYQTMLNSSQLEKDIQFKPPGNSVEPITKNSPNNLIEVIRGSCSMGTETGNKSVDSYLGCKSVFAFLC